MRQDTNSVGFVMKTENLVSIIGLRHLLHQHPELSLNEDDKYLDFDYDTNKWTRKDLENLMVKYGTNILFKFSHSSSLSF